MGFRRDFARTWSCFGLFLPPVSLNSYTIDSNRSMPGDFISVAYYVVLNRHDGSPMIDHALFPANPAAPNPQPKTEPAHRMTQFLLLSIDFRYLPPQRTR
jgi:hypothetical protein